MQQIKVSLAPLAGITDWPFRLLCFEQGCDEATTEMVSAMGYCFSPHGRATTDLLTKHPSEGKLKLQLFGKEPDYMSRAAAELSQLERYCGIDINMGCPAHKVAASGEGSGLMQTPDLAERIIREVVKQSRLPVSVKMRLGWDHDHINVIEMAQRAEAAGAESITIHGRTRMQMYSGEADWNTIALVKQTVRIPVYGNGDIFSAEDALKQINASGVDGIMIARGALGNPWIFRQIRDMLEGKNPSYPTNVEKISMCLRHYDMQLSWKPNHVAIGEMRKHIGWYIHGMRGAAQLRAQINLMDDVSQVKDRLISFVKEAEGESA